MEDIRDVVRDKYGEIAKTRTSCCDPGNSCCGSSNRADHAGKGIGYSDQELGSIPTDANLGLGCGNPTALAALRDGEVVVDLGSGGGIDCFLAAKQVGKSGKVIGVDMTADMISLARKNAEKVDAENIEFRLGEIENLPVADNTADVVISNCVINLSPDKQRVFSEAYRILKSGGRMMVSDIVLHKKIPDELEKSVNAYVGCVAGAMLKTDYLKAIADAGFEEINIMGEDCFGSFGETLDPYVQSLAKESNLSIEELREFGKSVVSIKIEGIKK